MNRKTTVFASAIHHPKNLTYPGRYARIFLLCFADTILPESVTGYFFIVPKSAVTQSLQQRKPYFKDTSLLSIK